MNKFTIPAILVVTVLVAGIFAFMPVEKASTVHTTLQSASSATSAHNLLQTISASNTHDDAQLNNIKSTFQTDLSANATASCGTSGGAFLVYYTFYNRTIVQPSTSENAITGLGISNSTGTTIDTAVALSLGNHTSVSGVVGGLSGATIIFSGNSSTPSGGGPSFEDTGDLSLTVVCQSGSTASLVP